MYELNPEMSLSRATRAPRRAPHTERFHGAVIVPDYLPIDWRMVARMPTPVDEIVEIADALKEASQLRVKFSRKARGKICGNPECSCRQRDF